MSRLTLFTLQLLVAVAAVLLWQVLTTVPIGGLIGVTLHYLRFGPKEVEEPKKEEPK